LKPIPGAATAVTAVFVAIVLITFWLLGGCSVTYGRLPPLGKTEAESLTCSNIDDEIRTVVSYVGTLYTDYHLKNTAPALSAAERRLDSLYLLRETRCDIPYPDDWKETVKAKAQIISDERKARSRHEALNNPRHTGDYIVSPKPKRYNPSD